MKKLVKVAVAIIIALNFVVITPMVMAQRGYAVQAASVKINYTKRKMYVSGVYTLKITGTNKTVKWSSSDKNIATVSSKGKVTAKKKGTATITAKVGKDKYTCKVTVKNLPKESSKTK